MVRNKALPAEYVVASGLDEQLGRAERERRVIEDLIQKDARFRADSVKMADLVLEAKRMALNGEDESRIAEAIAVQTGQF
jgi:hypothetical protein